MHKQTSQEHGNPCVFVMIAQVRRLTIEQNQGFVVSLAGTEIGTVVGAGCVGQEVPAMFGLWAFPEQ